MATRSELRTWLEQRHEVAQRVADDTYDIIMAGHRQKVADAYLAVLEKLDQLENGCAATQAYGATGCT
jgi:hypothetical protein